MDKPPFINLCISFLLAQVCEELIEFLNNQKDKTRRRYQDELEEHVKSSTDAALEHVKERLQTHNEALLKVKGKIESLGQWQEKAPPLM